MWRPDPWGAEVGTRSSLALSDGRLLLWTAPHILVLTPNRYYRYRHRRSGGPVPYYRSSYRLDTYRRCVHKIIELPPSQPAATTSSTGSSQQPPPVRILALAEDSMIAVYQLPPIHARQTTDSGSGGSGGVCADGRFEAEEDEILSGSMAPELLDRCCLYQFVHFPRDTLSVTVNDRWEVVAIGHQSQAVNLRCANAVAH